MTTTSTTGLFPFDTLRCDAKLVTPANHHLRQLIVDYSPVLVLFPEEPRDGPPWRVGKADYHPRAVEMYLDDARLIPPRLIRSKGPLLWFTLPLDSLLRRLLSVFPKRRRTGRAKAELARSIKARGDGLGAYTLDTGVAKSIEAWKRYHEVVKRRGKSYPPTAYVRAVKQGKKLALQYWFFYYFNDFWNRHQADFEFIAVYFREGRSGEYTPRGCGYAAHRGGRFRLWRDVRKIDETHPVAYIAKGSHATYPRPKLEGWTPALTTTISAPFLVNLHVNVVPTDRHGEARDIVPMPTDADFNLSAGLGGRYVVKVMPPDITTAVTPKNQPIWNDWWWLRFQGCWGPGNWTPYFFLTQPCVRGPAEQRDRWDDPWAWLHQKCEPDDVGDWSTL